MSLKDRLGELVAWEASHTHIELDGEAESHEQAGGRLEANFEERGQAALLRSFDACGADRLVLKDSELRIEVSRVEGGAHLAVFHGETPTVAENLVIPGPPVSSGPLFCPEPQSRVGNVAAAMHDPTCALFAVEEGDETAWYTEGRHGAGLGARVLLGTVPACPPERLGSAAFRAAHGVRWAYVAGAMAGGIASAELVIAMARNGLLGFFGSGGVPVPAVREALERIRAEAGDGVWGSNLLHNPVEPAVEEATVDLYLEYGVRRVSASAYMGLTPAVVRYRLHGIHEDAQGRVVCPNFVFAKVSRAEVAEHFMKPAPASILDELVERGALTAEQARLAARVPVATDVTAEADSGGHTDRRALLVLLPLLQDLRDRLSAEHGFDLSDHRPRVGAAGGLGTPAAVHAAFSMGAEYVLTGSVNQAALEAGTSPLAKQLLADAGMADVSTGPAPDMFEIGAHVQVLSRGSMYAQRAGKLYDLYKSCGSLDNIPEKERARLEKQVFKRPLDEVWEGTRDYWSQRDPEQVARAEADPRHKMALTFRWYLGMTSRWARTGESDRKRDFQIWCGPAMGGFNGWARGSSLEPVESRSVVHIAGALMQGAAAHARVSHARLLGLSLPVGIDAVRPPG